jgi:putative oxidoreductase
VAVLSGTSTVPIDSPHAKGDFMKLASIIARYLLGLIFLVFGLNGFLNFIHQPPPSNPLAIQFFVAVSASHYMVVVFLAQIIGGILLLTGRFVPLALAILAPVLVNILNYHITMDPGGIGLGLIATILWVIVLLPYRSSFAQIFQQRPHDETATTPSSPS